MTPDSIHVDPDANGGRAFPNGVALAAALDDYEAQSHREALVVSRIRELAAGGDPWTRDSLLHVTGSAFIVHPASRRVLLRWHDRMRSWLQVGGHADPGETDPFAIALREAIEETGLGDLRPWPGSADTPRPRLAHVVIVPVPAGRGEPAHEHADLRYLLATARPDAVAPESETALLRWLSIEEALEAVANDNIRLTIHRAAAAFDAVSN